MEYNYHTQITQCYFVIPITVLHVRWYTDFRSSAMMFNATFNNMGRKPKYTYLSVILLFLLQFYIHVILTLRVGLRCLTPPHQYVSYIVVVGCFGGGTGVPVPQFYFVIVLTVLYTCLYSLFERRLRVMVFNATCSNMSVISCRFYQWRKPECLEKTTNMRQINDKLFHLMLHRIHLA